MLRTRKQLIASTTGALVLLALASLALGQTGQTPKPVEDDDVLRTFSELVQTDVMVFDKQGKFVSGMKREDFELRIDGKPRPVEFFERINAGTSNEEVQLAAARGGASSAKGTAVPLDRGRTMFFYVDDLHLSLGSVSQTRKMLTQFVDQDLGQNDEVAITSASGQIGFLQQLSDNKAVLHAAIGRLNQRPAAVPNIERPPMSEYQALQIDHFNKELLDFYVDELLRESPGLSRLNAELTVQARVRQILQQAGRVTTNSLAGLESLVRSSAKLPGRKLVFFLSDGFFIDDHNGDVSDRLRKITSAAARTSTIIYTIDTRGLVAPMADIETGSAFDASGVIERSTHGEILASQDGLNALARDTGGRPFRNSNALGLGIPQALNETSVYYLLAWRPEHETVSGNKYRSISVKLIGHPDWNVRVRQGFFDIDPSRPTGRPKTKAQVATAANSTPPTPEALLRNELTAVSPKTDLPVALNLTYLNTTDDGALLVVSMHVPTTSLKFTNVESKLKGQVDVSGVIYNDRGKSGGRFSDHLTIVTEAVDALHPDSKELVYNFRVYVPPGIYQVRAGGRDAVAGTVGTAFAWIEIPDLRSHQLALSSLIIGERLPENMHATNTDPNAVAVATLRVDHHFHRDAGLRFIVYVYNAALSPTDSRPDAATQVQVLRDGQPVITTPSKRISTEGLQQLNQIPYGADVSLEGLTPGRYVLQVSVIDRVAKSSSSQRIRFEID
jgi:VWFA-related protein